MHTPCDVAVLEREQQSRAAANGAAVRFTRAEVTFPQFESHVGMYPYRNTLYSVHLSESGRTESLLKV